MKTTTLYVRDILLETECPVCRRETDYTTVCDACERDLEGLRLAKQTFSLVGKTPVLSACAAVFRYEEPTSSFLFYLKQHEVPCAFRIAASYMLAAASYLPLHDGTVFVHVPRRRAAIRRFGFDHAALLAGSCAALSAYASQFVPLLRRLPGHDAEQKTLGAEQRAENVFSRFALDMRAVKRMTGASGIVIVDDVITTGSSVSECAAVIGNAFHDIPIYALSLVKAVQQ